MSLFGSLLGDVEDDPFFGSHMRHMRQMNNMMNSLFSDPFSMFGGGLGGPMNMLQGHSNAMMPFMSQMPSMNSMVGMGRMFPDMNGNLSAGSSFSSSTVVMSSGAGGKPQVFSTSSSTKIGPNGVKETRKTLQDSRTGTKKMSIGHHIGERAHVIEREANVYSGDNEERQEFINLDEDEAEDFDREFQSKSGAMTSRGRIGEAPRRAPPLAIMAAPPASPAHAPPALAASVSPNSLSRLEAARRAASVRPAARRPLRSPAPTATAVDSASVRSVYGGPHPQRHRARPRPRHEH